MVDRKRLMALTDLSSENIEMTVFDKGNNHLVNINNYGTIILQNI